MEFQWKCYRFIKNKFFKNKKKHLQNLIVQAVGEAAENVQTGEEPERFDFVHCRVDSQPIMFNICSNNNNMFGGLARSSHAVFIFQVIFFKNFYF